MKLEDLKKLPPLNLPYADLRISANQHGELIVFDPLRKKNVVLTPEEFVRQNFIHWLNTEKKYPLSLLQNEVGVKLNDTVKRCDTIAYNRNGNPLAIIEYKAPDIEITQDVFDQIYRYNLSLRADLLIVSNGRRHFCCKMDYRQNSYHFIPVIPTFNEAMGLPMEN